MKTLFHTPSSYINSYAISSYTTRFYGLIVDYISFDYNYRYIKSTWMKSSLIMPEHFMLCLPCLMVKSHNIWKKIKTVPFKDPVNLTDTHLNTSSLFIRRKPNSIVSKVHPITLDPLACILASLCSYHRYQSRTAQVKLQPLPSVVLLCRPTSFVPPSSHVV